MIQRKEDTLDALLRTAARCLLALLGLWLLVLGVYNVAHRSDWAMGDWLINYSGGFVRRGLIGQGALLLGRLGLSPLWAVLALQWTLYAVVVSFVWRSLRALRWRPWLAAFVFSPATLALPLLDPPFAFRKEILLFALLAITLGIPFRIENEQAGPHRGDALLAALLTLGCAVCVLAHEGLIVYFPYLFGAVLLHVGKLRRAVVCFALPAAVSVALFVLVSRSPGNAQVSRTICQSIGGTMTVPPSGLCGGAVAYLSHGSAYAHSEVVRVARIQRYARSTPFLILLALLPAAWGVGAMWSTRRLMAKTLTTVAALAWLLSVSVFYYGTDWTRWIYVHAFCMFLLMLAVERQAQRRELPDPGVFRARTRIKQIGTAAVLLLYSFGWELTVYRQPLPLGGFVHFIRHELLTKPDEKSAHFTPSAG